MSTDEIGDTKLVELYHRYVGEPESRRDVYGYWLFLVGSVLGLSGVVVYQVEQAFFPGNLGIRELAIVLSAVGLALALFAIVVLLPVRRRGMQASLVGLVVAGVGVAAFLQVYPSAWYFEPDYSPEIIAVYTLGLAIIVGVVVLVPVVTGEKGLLVEPELGIGDDEAPILVGDATRDAFFTVFETPTDDWTWRAIQRDAVGQSPGVVPTDTDARMEVETVREKTAGAGLLDITTAAFRLYRTGDGEWRWSLVTADGGILARNADPYPDRDAVESTVNFLKEETADAGVVEIRGAAFDVYADEGDRWHWRLLDERRRPLAESVDAYAAEADADAGTDTFVDALEEPRVLALETVGIELFRAGDGEADAAADADGWRWRVIDTDDRRLVTGEAAYPDRGDAETAATGIADGLADAAVIEHGTPGFEVVRVGAAVDGTSADGPGDDAGTTPGPEAGWSWRLRDTTDDIIAVQNDRAKRVEAATAAAERVREALGDADVIQFEGADYEVYPAGGEWHWRLVSADRELLAESTDGFAGREAAVDAADRVREQALAADLIEFEQAAFQQYESDGEWRWRLIDEDGQVMADSGESYEDKQEVMDGMRTLKENAPDAEVLEIETAAFELYLTDGGEYAWRLIDEGGRLIAAGAETHPSRAAAHDAVDFVIDNVDDAAVRTIARPAFQLFRDDDAWGFWLVDTDGSVLATGTDDYPTYDDVTTAVADVGEAGDGADVDVLGPVTVQVRDGGGWHWRLLDRDRESIADGDRTYESREAARADVDRLLDGAAAAPVFDIGRGVVWVDRTDAGWRWRLVDADRTELAASPDTFETEADAMAAVETVQARAPDATTFEVDTLAFEPYRPPEADSPIWRWRLIDEAETVLAESAVGYDDRPALDDAIDDVRATTTGASILEIDEAAFEFAERGDGWIWRLVDENGAPIARSVRPHETRQEAREEMLVVKEHAPDGEVVVAW
jgi:uncharacterized protein YegP (UPF0339 family)